MVKGELMPRFNNTIPYCFHCFIYETCLNVFIPNVVYISLPDQSHLSYLPSRCIGCTPGGRVRKVSDCWNGKLHTPEFVPKLGAPASWPVSSSKYSLPTNYSCHFLNNKQSRIVSGACCTSAVLHLSHETHCLLQPIARVLGSPSSFFSAPLLQIPKIFPTMHYLLLLFTGFHFI